MQTHSDRTVENLDLDHNDNDVVNNNYRDFLDDEDLEMSEDEDNYDEEVINEINNEHDAQIFDIGSNSSRTSIIVPIVIMM